MIHTSAIIHPSAKIEPSVAIGPYSIIGPEVEIASGTEIASHVVIKGPCKIGKNNKFYQFSSIGEDTQDKKYSGERTELIIGDNNTFREYCTLHRGTVQGGGKTVIGNNNLFMVSSHVAHDCYIGNHVIFSNCASVAGHVKVQDYATLGGMVGVHQFCIIGAHSFAAGGSIIFKDVLPFVMVSGNPAKAYGLNIVGLNRRNFTADRVKLLKQAYKIIFKASETVAAALEHLNPLARECSDIHALCEFLMNSGRGIVR